jgi:conjugative relaxase-like TrwC/TraI family protein
MSLHKLTAGSGYDYLTRQVAALDATEKGHTGLASYYTERGETPGVWIGSGLDGIDGLAAGDPVTAEQMRALFGCGLHPLAELRQQQLEGPDLTTPDFQKVVQLGAPFKIFDGGVSPFRLEVARRFAVINTAADLPAGTHLPPADRARVRTEVAREFFLATHGREPIDARELAGQIAKDSRPRTQTVAGYDLTFSPVKSVSTLWAVADPAVAAVIERAHHAAVKDALAFIEKHALFTRTGPQGIRQVNVRGVVATAFTHRDSRAGDPDLHTHVAIANKVQTLDGRWLSIDGRVLFKANVAASETYNTALEQHLSDNLGIRFAERPGTDPAKRPIREIVGVDPRLNKHWSTRRTHIEVRRGELAIQFQHDHGRPPTPVEALHLAQQATLETRDAKHEPRSLNEQRATWHAEAAATLGSSEAVASMVQTALTPPAETATIADARWVAQTASRVLAVMEESRSTWQMWHVQAEAQRQVRTNDMPAEQATALVDLLVDEVLDRQCVALVAPDDIDQPEALRRVDGSSVYTVAGAALYTSTKILDAEQRLLTAAGQRDGASVEQTAVDLALLEMAANGTALDAGQASLVRHMSTSGARLQLAIAPAGAGKTTAMLALTLAWTQDGGRVLGLAPSAAAAAVLGEQTGIRADTLAKLTWSLRYGELPDWAAAFGPSTLLIIDEAGMADTLSLDAAVQFAIARHNRSHRTVRLPADYVRDSTGLGYATTIHAAQGVTADTMHGLVTGQESRQQLYTMLTRGRAANHLYLQVVGDGDPHTLIRPATVAPRTPTELLEQILARDDTPTSATTVLRQLNDPAARLFDAVQRYTDGLKVAAEQLVGPQIVHTLDRQADQVIPELTSEPSWPTLRAHLLALAAETDEHPLLHLQTAAAGRDLQTAGDMAAVLDWRLPEPASINPGPLPWLPGIPSTLHDHHLWAEYLAKRSQLVINLADQVRDCASQNSQQPVWAPPGSHPSNALICEVEVWRAAVGVDHEDRRPTGAGQLQTVAAHWQQTLDRDVALRSHSHGADVGKRQLSGPSQDHRREDQHRVPPTRAVRRSVPPGPRL